MTFALYSASVSITLCSIFIARVLYEHNLWVNLIGLLIIGNGLLYMLFTLFVWKTKSLRGMNVLITGAASGIGKDLAIELALKHKANVILWDIKKNKLESVAAEIKSAGGNVNMYTCDVTQNNLVEEIAQKVLKEVGDVDIIINNAGVAVGKSLSSITPEEITRTINVNLLGNIWVVKSFLSRMLNRNSGHIVTISSAVGMQGVNHISEYCASKFGNFGFAESLRRELLYLKSDIKTTIICPYMVDTGLFEGTKPMWFLSELKCKDVAQRIIQGIQYEEELVVIPDLLLIQPLMRFLPITWLDFSFKLSGAMSACVSMTGRGSDWVLNKSEK